MKRWYVFYTKSRQEKKIKDYLEKRGHEVFLPLQKVMRQWSDRRKKVETPLFNSYIFVYESEDRIPAILQTPGISWNIRHNNRPAALREKEIEIIQRFLSSGLLVEVNNGENVVGGNKVEVADGTLRGLTGQVIRTDQGNKFSVLLESIGHNIVVTIDPAALRAITD